MAALHELIAELVDEPDEVAAGIQTDRGSWAQSLVEAGYQVYAINPPRDSYQPWGVCPARPDGVRPAR